MKASDENMLKAMVESMCHDSASDRCSVTSGLRYLAFESSNRSTFYPVCSHLCKVLLQLDSTHEAQRT